MFPSWLHPRQWIDPLSSFALLTRVPARTIQWGESLCQFFFFFYSPRLYHKWIGPIYPDDGSITIGKTLIEPINSIRYSCSSSLMEPSLSYPIPSSWLFCIDSPGLNCQHHTWDTHEIYVTIVKRVFFLYDAWKNKCVCRGGYFWELLYSCAVELSLNKVYVISIIH